MRPGSLALEDLADALLGQSGRGSDLALRHATLGQAADLLVPRAPHSGQVRSGGESRESLGEGAGGGEASCHVTLAGPIMTPGE